MLKKYVIKHIDFFVKTFAIKKKVVTLHCVINLINNFKNFKTMAKKATRNANGVKYHADLVSETATTKAVELQLDAQHNALSNASEKSLENFNQLKSKKYLSIDLNEKGIFAEIQKGGKFSVNGVKFSTYTQKMVENSGIVRNETDIYFPDTDERKLVGSITSLKKRVETQRKKLIKLGLL